MRLGRDLWAGEEIRLTHDLWVDGLRAGFLAACFNTARGHSYATVCFERQRPMLDWMLPIENRPLRVITCGLRVRIESRRSLSHVDVRVTAPSHA